MIQKKMLLTMYEYSYFLVEKAVEEITHSESIIFPPGGDNPANWILGHIVASRCIILAILDIDPPCDFEHCKIYIPDSKPLSPGDKVEDFEITKRDLGTIQDLLLNALDHISTDELNEQRGENTIGEELSGYAIHESFHTGELTTLKNILVPEYK